jgi:hypothetical protein
MNDLSPLVERAPPDHLICCMALERDAALYSGTTAIMDKRKHSDGNPPGPIRWVGRGDWKRKLKTPEAEVI